MQLADGSTPSVIWSTVTSRLKASHFASNLAPALVSTHNLARQHPAQCQLSLHDMHTHGGLMHYMAFQEACFSIGTHQCTPAKPGVDAVHKGRQDSIQLNASCHTRPKLCSGEARAWYCFSSCCGRWPSQHWCKAKRAGQ